MSFPKLPAITSFPKLPQTKSTRPTLLQVGRRTASQGALVALATDRVVADNAMDQSVDRTGLPGGMKRVIFPGQMKPRHGLRFSREAYSTKSSAPKLVAVKPVRYIRRSAARSLFTFASTQVSAPICTART